MIVSIVVAISDNHAIGKNNQLIWHLPADLKHFKEITTGHSIIMGRKTFDSIGKALPNRRNIVISRNTSLQLPGAEVCHSLDAALQLCQDEEEVFVIGGAEIFESAFPLTQKIYLTRVHQIYEADTFFPEINPEQWVETEVEHHQADAKNGVDYTFSTLKSK